MSCLTLLTGFQESPIFVLYVGVGMRRSLMRLLILVQDLRALALSLFSSAINWAVVLPCRTSRSFRMYPWIPRANCWSRDWKKAPQNITSNLRIKTSNNHLKAASKNAKYFHASSIQELSQVTEFAMNVVLTWSSLKSSGLSVKKDDIWATVWKA